jgi:hypothetical protein
VKPLAILCLAAGVLAAGDNRGIRPRPNSSDYAAHRTAGGMTLAAAVVPPEQVPKLFATDLNKAGYVVVEVAVYPESGNEVDVQVRDFLLQIGRDSATVRAVNAAVIASRMHQKNSPKPPPIPADVNVYPTATVGYETGGYDPVTGRRRSGVYTGAGVGVGIGQQPGPPPPPPAGSTDRDRSTMEQELTDKALPQVKTTVAVAGYLYFPKPASAKKDGPYQLTYYGERGQIHLTVPPPGKK